jgi:hypothetical protein
MASPFGVGLSAFASTDCGLLIAGCLIVKDRPVTAFLHWEKNSLLYHLFALKSIKNRSEGGPFPRYLPESL